MITVDKINIYSKYKGDIDMWSRTGKSKEKQIMQSKDWYLIDSLLQDLMLIKNGLASEDYIKSLNERLIENCDNDETVRQLKALS